MIQDRQQQCPHGTRTVSDSALMHTGQLLVVLLWSAAAGSIAAEVVGYCDEEGWVDVTAAAAARLDGTSLIHSRNSRRCDWFITRIIADLNTTLVYSAAVVIVATMNITMQSAAVMFIKFRTD